MLLAGSHVSCQVKNNMDSRQARISLLNDYICDNAGGAMHMLKAVQVAHEACEALRSTQLTPAGIGTLWVSWQAYLGSPHLKHKPLLAKLDAPQAEQSQSPASTACETLVIIGFTHRRGSPHHQDVIETIQQHTTLMEVRA